MYTETQNKQKKHLVPLCKSDWNMNFRWNCKFHRHQLHVKLFIHDLENIQPQN